MSPTPKCHQLLVRHLPLSALDLLDAESVYIPAERLEADRKLVLRHGGIFRQADTLYEGTDDIQ